MKPAGSARVERVLEPGAGKAAARMDWLSAANVAMMLKSCMMAFVLRSNVIA